MYTNFLQNIKLRLVLLISIVFLGFACNSSDKRQNRLTNDTENVIHATVTLETYPFLWYNSKTASDTVNTNTYTYFRKSIQLTDKPQSAFIKISAGNYYKFWVNGKYVGKGPVRESAPWYQYDTYNIADLLQQGKNVLAVHVYHRGLQTFTEKVYVIGLFTEGEIKLGNKTIEIKASPEGWKVKQDLSFLQNSPEWSTAIKGPSKTTGWGPGPQEYKDLRKELDGWQLAGFDDSNWQTPSVIGTKLKFYERLIPQLRETVRMPVEIMRLGEVSEPYATRLEIADRLRSSECFAARFKQYPIKPLSTIDISNPENLLYEDGIASKITIPAGKAAYIQIDFGNQLMGYPRLVWNKGVEGTVVELTYSDDFLSKDTLNCSYERTYLGGQLILKDGKQSYEAQYLIHVVNYMGILIRNMKNEPIELELDAVNVNSTSFPVEIKGSFWCDDAFYNHMYDVSEWTMRLCMIDLFGDCPRREQVQWISDVVLESYMNYYLYGESSLVKQFLLMGTHRPDGDLPSFIPSSDLWNPDIKSYPLHYIESLYYYYMYTGDSATLKQVLPKADALLPEYFKYVNADGVYDPKSNRQIFDIEPVDEGYIPRLGAAEYGSHLHNNCYLSIVLRQLASLHKKFGNPALVGEYETRATSIENATKKHFWSEQSACYMGGYGGGKNYISTAFNGDAVWSGIASDKQIDLIWPSLFNADASPKSNVTAAGLFGSFFLVRGLFKGPEQYHHYINSYYRRYYKAMLDFGATTFWEKFPANGKIQKNSFVHGTGANFPFFAGANILGVKPLSPGFDKFQIFPSLMHLGIAKGSVPTPHGNINVEWERSGSNSLKLQIEVPENTTAYFFPPEKFLLNADTKVNIIDLAGKSKEPITVQQSIIEFYKQNLFTAYILPQGRYQINIITK